MGETPATPAWQVEVRRTRRHASTVELIGRVLAAVLAALGLFVIIGGLADPWYRGHNSVSSIVVPAVIWLVVAAAVWGVSAAIAGSMRRRATQLELLATQQPH